LPSARMTLATSTMKHWIRSGVLPFVLIRCLGFVSSVEAIPAGDSCSTEPLAPSYRLKAVYTAEQIGLLEKLNRTDSHHLVLLRTVVVHEQWDRLEVDYSPLPLHYSGVEQFDKALVVHLPSQLWCLRKGES
jgi:hypothetical protein